MGKNSSAIPRPINCFLIYRLEKQKQIAAKCPDINHREMSQVIAKWWKESSAKEKAPYIEKARIAKAEHKILYPDYKFNPKKKAYPKRLYVCRKKKKQLVIDKDLNKLADVIQKPNCKRIGSGSKKTKNNITIVKPESLSKKASNITSGTDTTECKQQVYHQQQQSAFHFDLPPMMIPSFYSATSSPALSPSPTLSFSPAVSLSPEPFARHISNNVDVEEYFRLPEFHTPFSVFDEVPMASMHTPIVNSDCFDPFRAFTGSEYVIGSSSSIDVRGLTMNSSYMFDNNVNLTSTTHWYQQFYGSFAIPFEFINPPFHQ